MCISEPSLTPVGYIWALFSILTACGLAMGFYVPYWLTDGHLCIYDGGTNRNTSLSGDQFCTRVHFGPFRRCGYPRPTEFQLEVIAKECGRYRHFNSIPSNWWKLTTALVGLACGLALLIALIAIPSCCVGNVLTKQTGRMFGLTQLISGVCSTCGTVMFPLGWENQEVREVCGPTTGRFILGHRTSETNPGSCKIGWAYWLVLGSALSLFICCGLSYKAGRPITVLTPPPKNVSSNQRRRGDDLKRLANYIPPASDEDLTTSFDMHHNIDNADITTIKTVSV